MAIVTSTILRKDGTAFQGFVRFTPHWQTPPETVDDLQPITTATSGTGVLSQRLAPGYYRCEVGNNPSVLILVPADAAEDDSYDLSTLVVGPRYAPSASGVQGAFIMYYGKSTNAILTGAEVAALLTSKSTGTIDATYDFAAGAGYMFFCWPESQGSPAAGTGFMVGSFGVPMATAAEGFDQTQNGYAYKAVTVEGIACRLYRSYNLTNGAATIQVNK